jgi:hypothetical protein
MRKKKKQKLSNNKIRECGHFNPRGLEIVHLKNRYGYWEANNIDILTICIILVEYMEFDTAKTCT